MKIDFSVFAEEKYSLLSATPGEIDGFPAVSRLRFDVAPSTVSPDRIAVAGILAFRRYISGQVQFESRISALTAELIARFMQPRWVHVTPLHPSNLPIPRGNKTLELRDSISMTRADAVLAIVRKDRYQGAIFGADTTIIPSNAWVIDQLDTEDEIDTFSARLAVAVLMAEDLNTSVIKIENLDIKNASDFSVLKDLLGAVGLGLELR